MVDRNTLLKRISAYQFAIYDLALFLDSHPCDEAGMQLMRMYQDKLCCLINEYEQSYGPLVRTHMDVQESWTEWVRDPWPWDNCKGDV